MSNVKKIKLVAIDLDGTLLNDDKELSEANIRAITEVQDQGIQVVICTGRPLKSMRTFAKQLNMTAPNDLVVTYNGGLIRYLNKEKILKHVTLGVEDVRLLSDLAKKLKLPLCLVDLERIYELPYPLNAPSLYQLERRGSEDDGGLLFQSFDLKKLTATFTFQKAVMSRPAAELDRALSEIPASMFERYNVFKTQADILEILPKKVDKGQALEFLMKELELEREQVLALGDHENDRSLLEAAGIGIAMGNAVDSVKSIADDVTATNNENGVAEAINKFILNK